MIPNFLFITCLGKVTDGSTKSPGLEQREQCTQDAYRLKNLCDDEFEYLTWAASFQEYPNLKDLTPAVLRRLMFKIGDMDKISALFYLRAIKEPRTARYLEYLDQHRKAQKKQIQPLKNGAAKKITFAVVPGMFYKDNPNVGADGKGLRKLAGELGLHPVLILTHQTGTIDGNAGIVCDFLAKHDPDRKVILASISKSGGEVKRALQICPENFSRVTGWLNVAGLLYGSYMANIVADDFWLKLRSRFYFWKRNYNWNGLLSLKRGNQTR